LAISDFNEAIKRDAQFAQAYNNRGHVLYQTGNAAAALADFSQALCLDPTLTDAYINRAQARTAINDAEGALQDYQQAMQLREESLSRAVQ
jgi:tetratricopeptide (TPR) repeat protein